MIPSNKIIAFTKSWEKCVLHPYQDSRGKWTIGWGNTFYEDGTPVRSTDKPITQDRADELFANIYMKVGIDVLRLLKVSLNENQFDALCDFDYNKGTARLKGSGLLKAINANPNDPNIPNYFRQWKYSDGEVLPGLVERANNNADIYSKGVYINHK